MDTRYEWHLAEQPDKKAIDELAANLGVAPFLARLLLQRGVTTKEAYEELTTPTLAGLHDPYLLHDMGKAVERIRRAVEQDEQIVIYGDYDVDGLTATSIMLETLQSLGAEPISFIPDRFVDGYGPNAAVYDYFIKNGAQLLITVDNGIAGKEVIDEAMAAGLDVIVTDHHELPADLPDAVAVVHPRYPGSDYPFGDLSGAGVSFKVATALLEEAPIDSIDLAALGAIADLVSLTDENRIIVQLGLRAIRTQPRLGLEALLKAADVPLDQVDETTVGFTIAPRLNAIGRLGDANPGVTLLTTFDPDQATTLANKIDALNVERQDLVKSIFNTALALATTPENEASKTLVLAQKGWHQGVLGIVASRIVEATGKPTVVLSIDEKTGIAKGSGRSIEGYNLFEALDKVRDNLAHFGGHAMAAGLSVELSELATVQRAMNEAADNLGELPKPTLEIASRVEASELTTENYVAMRALAPFGNGNPEPLFELKPRALTDVRTMGQAKDHLRFVADGVTVVAFGRGSDAAALLAAQAMKLAVSLSLNTWKGRTTPQLMLSDWRLIESPIIDMRLPQASAEQFRGAYQYVFFDAKKRQRLTQQFMFGGPTRLASELSEKTSDVVLVDLPKTLDELEAVLLNVTPPLRIVFDATPQELLALPTRYDCAGVLKALKQAETLDKHQLGRVANDVHQSVGQVILIVQMFLELGFVTLKGDMLSVVSTPEKRALEDAPTYQRRAKFLQLASNLLQRDAGKLASDFSINNS